MKTNMINTNSVMKNYMKFICAILMLLGTSAHAWGAANIAEGRYELVTDISTLSTSDRYIIAGTASNVLYAAKPFANASADKLTVYNLGSWSTTSPTTSYDITSDMGICEFALGGSTDAWTFHDGNYPVYQDGDGKLRPSSGSGYTNTWKIIDNCVGVVNCTKVAQLTIRTAADITKKYLRFENSGDGLFRCYNSSGGMYLFKKVPSVTLHEGVGGASTSTIAIGDYFPNDAEDVPGWFFTGEWATSAHSNEAPDYPGGAIYDHGDASTAGTYYAIYQGSAYGCNYGDYSCKPAATYLVNVTNPASGAGVNWVVPDVGCGPAGTIVTLTYTINVGGTSYQGASVVRDDNSAAVSFVHDAEEQTITFTLPASDVTAIVNFECPDIHSSTVTIPTITPVYNTSTSKWEATAAWNAVDGATNYKVQLGNRTTETVLTSPNPTVVTTTSYTNDAVLKNLTVDNEYRLMVQAYNSCDAEHPTAYSYQDFTPHCAELEGTLAIALDEVGSTTANLSWSGATTPAIQTTAGANSSLKYDVQITRTLPLPAGATGGVLDASNVTYTSWEGTGLTTGATYRIDVTAKNACGETMAASRTFKCKAYEDYLFTCADLSLTDEDGTHAPIWITSTAGKMVRSQKALHIEGTGLKPNGAITFTIGGVAANNCASGDVFAIRQANGSAVAADASGDIDMDVYVFYQPSVATDGLDLNAVGTAIVATSAEGTVPPAVREYKAMSATLANVAINGRHLPADFVIAAKNTTTNKWYALPANMSGTGNPEPVEIAVDDINNPTIAYTAASNIYNLYENGTKQYIQLGMKNNKNGSDKSYALWANNAIKSTDIGKNTGLAESSLGGNYQWLLTQTVAAAANAQSTAYTISNPNNANPLKLWLAAGGTGVPYWGLYASGLSELRLIPASDIPFTEAYFVEWAQHGGVVEVDATGIDATSVVAHLNGASSSAITLSQTLTSGKGRASIYDYTVNFGNDINFAAAASNGALLTLEWKNGETVKAITSLLVPKIIAASNDMHSIMSGDAQWETEVHVLPGVTLTANAGDFSSNDVMIKQLEIYPGATVVVTKGSQASGTLKVKTLVLRNGWTRAGEKAYDVARLYITPTTASLAKNAADDVWYTDWYIDYDQYYPIAVPWDVTLANITYRYCSVEPTVGHDKNIRLRYYDGSSRAGGGAIGTNWKLYGASGAESVPTKLEPSKGYALTAKRPSGKAFSILRMPLTIPSADWTAGGEKGEVSSVHKNQVSVTGWGSGTAQWYAMGWNFIGNPYMCTFNGDDDGISGKLVDQQGKGVRYATIPDVDFKNYDQVAIADADLKPASGFFIQAENPEATYITFASSNIVPPSAPARYTTQEEAVPEQEAYIRLSYEGGKDQMGLIIGEDYTENYEVNADLAKVLGDGNFVKTYMQYGGMDMAYVAINGELAKAWIPVTVILPTSGEYTYSLTASSEVEELEGVYLIDYANNNKITNLINENYVFTAAEAGTISNRFAINAIMGERKTPTGIDAISAGADLNSDKPFKFIWHDKVFILHHGVIYDATGKKVREINK